VKISVDNEKCTGHGICESLAEDVFEVGEDGLVHLLAPAPSDEQRDAVREAVEQCPAQALALQD
jgi:ferredoxin